MADLTEHTAETDVTNIASQFPDVYKQCLFLQSEFDTLTSNQAAELYKSKRMYFEQGDKADRLLAHQL